ncbi:SMP-30/gluconolactonase/LRE family protein [Actinomycetes bacterium KLBMP 9759]
MDQPRVLLEDIQFGECPRWHDGRLWFSDWGAQELVTVDAVGTRQVVHRPAGAPFCTGWLPDGRQLLLSPAGLQRKEPDGTWVEHAALPVRGGPWNEVVVDRRGNAYLDEIGFDMMSGAEPRPGTIVLATPEGAVRQVADDVHFPNGMAVTPDGSTLLVAESYRNRVTAFDIDERGDLGNRRVFADTPGDHPDGICLDAEGALWYADVGNKRCVRVREGGEILQVVTVDRGCFACALGGPEGRTLFIVAMEWSGLGGDAANGPTGQVLAVEVEPR